jgi:tellurite resistance protein
MIALLANWRVMAAAGLVAAVVGGWLYVGHLRKEAATARSEAVAAEDTAQLATATTRVVERYHETERTIREEAEPIIQTIRELPDAETPIPADILGAWRGGIERLRDDAAAADDNRSRDAGANLPAPPR